MQFKFTTFWRFETTLFSWSSRSWVAGRERVCSNDRSSFSGKQWRNFSQKTAKRCQCHLTFFYTPLTSQR